MPWAFHSTAFREMFLASLTVFKKIGAYSRFHSTAADTSTHWVPIFQLRDWLPSLSTEVRLRMTLLWCKPCCFSNVNYFVIMLTRYWSLPQQGQLQPHSKSKVFSWIKNCELACCCFTTFKGATSWAINFPKPSANKRVSKGWWLSRLLVKILAIEQLLFNFIPFQVKETFLHSTNRLNLFALILAQTE